MFDMTLGDVCYVMLGDIYGDGAHYPSKEISESDPPFAGFQSRTVSCKSMDEQPSSIWGKFR